MKSNWPVGAAARRGCAAPGEIAASPASAAATAPADTKARLEKLRGERSTPSSHVSLLAGPDRARRLPSALADNRRRQQGSILSQIDSIRFVNEPRVSALPARA